jgi:hypothetical protein
MLRALLLSLAALFAVPAAAAKPQDLLQDRAEEVLVVLKGGGDPAALFAPEFLAQVPAEQFRAISSQLREQFGAPLAVRRIDREGPLNGVIVMDFERSTLSLRIALQEQPPGLVRGLLVVASEVKGDSWGALAAEIKALHGSAGFAASRLGAAAPEPLASLEPERAMAIGSGFKLFILAELVREVRAGTRKWSDVAPLSRRSLPSGILQGWPEGSPLTLHSLASLMISQSDNSAADTLLALLGRDKVEALLPALGVAQPERNRPFLSTIDAFALKIGDPALRDEWLKADDAGRRRLLTRIPPKAPALDLARLSGKPLLTEEVEWFASPADLVRVMDWLRRNGDDTALAILAINPGLAPAASRFAYLGFKGGSESGVLSMTFLARTRAGGWRALSMVWNDPAEPVDEAKLGALALRALALMEKP